MSDRARRIEAELEELARELARQGFGARDWAEGLELRVSLEPEAGGGFRYSGPGLDERLQRALREAAAASSPWRSGRLYCHRCETSGCPHGVPGRPTEVFAGYGQTGLPLWEDFAQVLLADGHEGVEHLYDDGRRLVAHFEEGEALKSRQLAAFGRSSKTYDVLAQATAGWFRLQAPGERLALSFQAVEHRGPRGGLRLDLNVIGRAPDGREPDALLAEAFDERHHAAVRSARSSLRGVQQQLRATDADHTPAAHDAILARVPGILRKLARNLTATDRRRERRTGHAEHRRRQSRPVPSALREAQRAQPERVLFDEHEGTLIVRGKRGRVHVFAPDGRLVTSLSLEPDAVDRRVRRGRWRPATDEERADFRRSLDRVARSG